MRTLPCTFSQIAKLFCTHLDVCCLACNLASMTSDDSASTRSCLPFKSLFNTRGRSCPDSHLDQDCPALERGTATADAFVYVNLPPQRRLVISFITASDLPN